VSTLAASIYNPSHAEDFQLFGVSEEAAILPLALYNPGLAFGPLMGTPLSERSGRKVVFLTTTPVFAGFTLAAGLLQSAVCLNVCRSFAGVFTSLAINASATIIDYTAGRYRGISLAFYYSIPFFGAAFG
jgi:DHA1 family multidrug resistance protein-like MFS transporter